MIGRLSGRVVEHFPDGGLVIDVGGVGYEVIAPLGTVGRASPDADGLITLSVHTHVREDALLLYAFATRDDRDVFRTLIGVSNVGPRMAIAILSTMTAGDLARAIMRAEIGKLTGIPGIGKKTAERLMLELKGKLDEHLGDASAAGVTTIAPSASPKNDLLLGALTRMGFRSVEAERAIATLGPRVEQEPLGDLVREALALLSTR